MKNDPINVRAPAVRTFVIYRENGTGARQYLTGANAWRTDITRAATYSRKAIQPRLREALRLFLVNDNVLSIGIEEYAPATVEPYSDDELIALVDGYKAEEATVINTQRADQITYLTPLLSPDDPRLAAVVGS